MRAGIVLWLTIAALIGCNPAKGGAAGAAVATAPAWWNSTLGTEPLVLPGFEPLRVLGTSVVLGGRRYVWDRSFLPVWIESLGEPLTGPLELVARVAGEHVTLVPESVEVTETHGDHVIVTATGTPLRGLAITSTTRIEYDGVAMTTLRLTPQHPVAVDGLAFEVGVARNRWTRVLAFGTDADPNSVNNVRSQLKQVLLPLDYSGRFRNVVGFADGHRSFWWFADNAEGWIWNGPAVTEVTQAPEEIRLRQHLIGGPWRISEPLTLKFNFLATPVRELGSSWRTERVTALPPEFKGERGKFHWWWPDAFPALDLLYSRLPPEIRKEFPDEKWDAYPGAAAVRKEIERHRKNDYHRLPYFSGHCLSPFDPALRRYRAQWEMEPDWVNGGTPCLSHRAAGYSNYVLYRLDAEIDALGMTGIYLDQGSVMESRNPHHGGWTDSNGERQSSLDVLAYREFLKRLRVLFASKGKPGYVVVHSSNSEVIPALTFATSTLDGEQFRVFLNNEDYISSVSLDMVRTLFAGNQYGVVDTWLPASWAIHGDDANWEGSTEQYRAYRNFMTLALLHDIPIWPAGVARKDYDALIDRLDGFGVSESDFFGYWREHPGALSREPETPISFYRRYDRAGVLLVVPNLDAQTREIEVRVDPVQLELSGSAYQAQVLPLRPKDLAADGVLRVHVPGKNFTLVEIRPK